MARLKYVGAAPAAASDLIPVTYTQGVKTQDLSTSAVDAQINDAYASYADKSAVDAGDALLANKAFIDAGDAQRVKISQKEVNNGVVGLGANGKVSASRLNVPTTQRWPRAFWSPNAYNAGNVDITTEFTVYTCGVTDPGYPYRIAVFGNADLAVSTNDEFPAIIVRVGNDGDIIARGDGLQHSYFTSTGLITQDLFQRTVNPGLGSDWQIAYANGNGNIVTNGNEASWDDGGTNTNEAIALRINELDRFTHTDDQRITVVYSNGLENPSFGTSGSNYIYLRSSLDGQQWVRLGIGPTTCRFQYSTSGLSGETNTGPNLDTPSNHADDVVFQVTAFDRTFQVYRNGVFIGEMVDTTNVTPKGPANRGWGFGMRAVGHAFGQHTPSRITRIDAEDFANEINSSAVSFFPSNMPSQTIRTGPTTLHVKLIHTSASGPGSAIARARAFKPGLWVMAVPA